MNFISTLKIKILNPVIAGVFIFVNIIGNFSYAYARESYGSEEDCLSALSIPSSYGRIVDKNIPSSSEYDPVFLIQDLHANQEVQKNIFNIISHLNSVRPVRKIAVEGTSGKIDTSLFKSIPGRSIKENTVAFFMNRSLLSGPEAFAILKETDMELKGAEDIKLYRKNLKVLLDSLNSRPEAVSLAGDVRKLLFSLESRIFNRELKSFRQITEGYRRNKLSREKFHENLAAFARKTGVNIEKSHPGYSDFMQLTLRQQKLDLEKAFREYKEILDKRGLKTPEKYKEKTILDKIRYLIRDKNSFKEDILFVVNSGSYPHLKRYLSFLRNSEKLTPHSLITQENSIVKEIGRALCLSREEKKLLFVSDYFNSLNRFLFNQIPREEYEEFTLNSGRFRNRFLYLKEKGHPEINEIGQKISMLSPHLKIMGEFYRLAVMRDTAFAQKGISWSKKKKGPLVLVAGGFHSRGVTKKFQRKNIPYFVISPDLTSHDSENVHRYYRLMQGEETLSYSDLVRDKSSAPVVFGDGYLHDTLAFPLPSVQNWVKKRYVASAVNQAWESEMLTDDFVSGWINRYIDSRDPEEDFLFNSSPIFRAGNLKFVLLNFPAGKFEQVLITYDGQRSEIFPLENKEFMEKYLSLRTEALAENILKFPESIELGTDILAVAAGIYPFTQIPTSADKEEIKKLVNDLNISSVQGKEIVYDPAAVAGAMWSHNSRFDNEHDRIFDISAFLQDPESFFRRASEFELNVINNTPEINEKFKNRLINVLENASPRKGSGNFLYKALHGIKNGVSKIFLSWTGFFNRTGREQVYDSRIVEPVPGYGHRDYAQKITGAIGAGDMLDMAKRGQVHIPLSPPMVDEEIEYIQDSLDLLMRLVHFRLGDISGGDENREKAVLEEILEKLKIYREDVPSEIVLFNSSRDGIKGPENYLISFVDDRGRVALPREFMKTEKTRNFIPEIILHEIIGTIITETDIDRHRENYEGIQADIMRAYYKDMGIRVANPLKQILRDYINRVSPRQDDEFFDGGVRVVGRGAGYMKAVRDIVDEYEQRLDFSSAVSDEVMDVPYDEIWTKIKVLEEIAGERGADKVNIDLKGTMTWVDGIINLDSGPKAVHTHRVYFHEAPNRRSEINEGNRRVKKYIKEQIKQFESEKVKKELGSPEKIVLVFDYRGYREIRNAIKKKMLSVSRKYPGRYSFKFIDHEEIDSHSLLLEKPYRRNPDGTIFTDGRGRALPDMTEIRKGINELLSVYAGEEAEKIIEGLAYARYVGMLLEVKVAAEFFEQGYNILQVGEEAFDEEGVYLTELDVLVQDPEKPYEIIDGKKYLNTRIIECKSARTPLKNEDMLEDKVAYKLRSYRNNYSQLTAAVERNLRENNIISSDIEGVIISGVGFAMDVGRNEQYKAFLQNKALDLEDEFDFPVSFHFTESSPEAVSSFLSPGIRSSSKNLKKSDLPLHQVDVSIANAVKSGRAAGFSPVILNEIAERGDEAIDEIFEGTSPEIAETLAGGLDFETPAARKTARINLSRYLAQWGDFIIPELKSALRLLAEALDASSQNTLGARRFVILFSEDDAFSRAHVLAHSGAEKNSIYLHINTFKAAAEMALPGTVNAIIEHEDRDLLRGQHESDIFEKDFARVKKLWDKLLREQEGEGFFRAGKWRTAAAAFVMALPLGVLAYTGHLPVLVREYINLRHQFLIPGVEVPVIDLATGGLLKGAADLMGQLFRGGRVGFREIVSASSLGISEGFVYGYLAVLSFPVIFTGMVMLSFDVLYTTSRSIYYRRRGIKGYSAIEQMQKFIPLLPIYLVPGFIIPFVPQFRVIISEFFAAITDFLNGLLAHRAKPLINYERLISVFGEGEPGPGSGDISPPSFPLRLLYEDSGVSSLYDALAFGTSDQDFPALLEELNLAHLLEGLLTIDRDENALSPALREKLEVLEGITDYISKDTEIILKGVIADSVSRDTYLSYMDGLGDYSDAQILATQIWFESLAVSSQYGGGLVERGFAAAARSDHLRKRFRSLISLPQEEVRRVKSLVEELQRDYEKMLGEKREVATVPGGAVEAEDSIAGPRDEGRGIVQLISRAINQVLVVVRAYDLIGRSQRPSFFQAVSSFFRMDALRRYVVNTFHRRRSDDMLLQNLNAYTDMLSAK